MMPEEEFVLSMVTMNIWKEEMRSYISHDEAMVHYELARLGDFRQQWNGNLWQGIYGLKPVVKPMYEEMLFVGYDKL